MTYMCLNPDKGAFQLTVTFCSTRLMHGIFYRGNTTQEPYMIYYVPAGSYLKDPGSRKKIKVLRDLSQAKVKRFEENI